MACARIGAPSPRGRIFRRASAYVIAATALLTVLSAGAVDKAEPDAFASPDQLARTVVRAVDSANLHETIMKLVGFGTRHTASETQSATRGIGAARRWAAQRFRDISSQCKGCLEIVTPSRIFTGESLAAPTDVVDIVAIQRGSEDPRRVIFMTAHLDSRVTDIHNATDDAPGANDDGSGVAAVLESARILSRHQPKATIIYGILSGEEEGLWGGEILADYAREQGWQVVADLNNDIIGNTDGGDGVHDNTVVRVFSEGTRSTESAEEARRRRYLGGEVDSPSRSLARYLAQIAASYVDPLRVEMVYRTDRYGRGGDQVPFLQHGFPAVRITEAHENYARQHQDVRVEQGVHYGDVLDGIDFAYLAQVTRLNAIALGFLANAPAPPSGVTVKGAVSPDTQVSWQASPMAAQYRVYKRATTAAQWPAEYVAVSAEQTELLLKNVTIDNWFFGVAALSSAGFASPIVFPGEAGAFPQ